jgi:ABC-type bacteriocin/lantibiotic exporter with double-glycine peptidase domain
MKNLDELLPIIRKLLKAEKAYYSSVVILSIFLSLISLAIPISVQSLVNTVVFGVLLQPIVVLSLLLLFVLSINVVLNGLLYRSLEYFQQHFFAKMSLDIVSKILNASSRKLAENSNKYILSHRYFDIMTVQKSMTVILSDGSFIFLQLFAGMILISLYHPYFLIFDIILIVSLFFLWRLFGPAAIKTAITESTTKYAMGRWIDQVANQSALFCRHPDLAYNNAEVYATKYIEARNSHFKNLFAQIVGLFILYAILSAFVLGVGGFLVIKGELSMGQLIAAEIIVTIILTSLTKLGKILEKTYDLLAALSKLDIFQHMYEVKSSILDSDRIELKNIHVQDKSNDIHIFNFKLDPKQTYLLKSNNVTKMNAFLKLLNSEYDVQRGQFHIASVEHTNLLPKELLLKNFYILEKPEIISDTIKNNIKLSSNIKLNVLTEYIHKIKLEDSISNLPNGLDTVLNSDGSPLSFKDLLRIDLLRTLINRPRFIVLTHVFRVFTLEEQKEIFDLLQVFEIGVIATCEIKIFNNSDDYEVLDIDHGSES